MSRTLTVGVLVAAGVGLVAVRRLASQRSASTAGDESRSRWRAVTVYRAQEEVMPEGRAPEPLTRFDGQVEVEVRPAPGGRGTELRARLRSPEPGGVAGVAARLTGNDPRQDLRSALREAKQLLEVGEVLRLEPISHGDRGHTPGGKLIEAATNRAGGEGLL